MSVSAVDVTWLDPQHTTCLKRKQTATILRFNLKLSAAMDLYISVEVWQ